MFNRSLGRFLNVSITFSLCPMFLNLRPIIDDFSYIFPNWKYFTRRYGCSVNFLHIFKKPFPKTSSGRLLLNILKTFLEYLEFYNVAY